MAESLFVSGPWTLAQHCRKHGGNTESCVLSFQDGRISGEGEESRIEGTYDATTGQVTLRIGWENESVDYWSGVAVEGAILGWWRDVVSNELAKEPCMGAFRMWPEPFASRGSSNERGNE